MRGITPVNNNSHPSFGINWTKSTEKFLKKVAPSLVQEDGFETAKLAITKLAELGQRQDGLTARIELHRKCLLTSPGFEISVKDKTIPFFVYGPTRSSLVLPPEHLINTALELKNFSENFSGDDFLKTSHEKIEETATYLKNRTLKEKINDLRNSIGYKIDDFVDWVWDVFSPTEVIGKNNKRYILPSALNRIAESFHSRLIKSKTENRKRCGR